MKLIKILLWVFFFLIVVMIGIGIFFVASFDANHYKQQITQLVNKQTGRELTIDGDLSLAFYPDVAIELGETTLSNAAGFGAKHFAAVGSAQVSVKVMPLLQKQLNVDEIRLTDLQLNLQRKADGSTNWDDLVTGEKKAEDKQAKEPAAVVKELTDNLSIAGLSLKNATINWQDAQANQNLSLTPLNLTTGNFKPGKPLPVEFDLVMQQQKPNMKVVADAKTTVTLDNDQQFTLANLILNAQVTGEPVPNGALKANIKGDVSGNPQNISVPNLQAMAKLTGDLIPKGEINADVNGALNLDLKQQLLSLKGMRLNANVNGETLAGGNAQAVVSGDTQFNLANQLLQIPNLSLDATMQGGYVRDGQATSSLTGNLTVDLAKSQVTIPQLSINSDVTGGVVPGGKLNQQAQGAVNLNWINKQGGIDLSNLLVQLADLQLSGKQVKIHPLAENPAVSGQFSTNTFNLKQALKTLGITPPQTSNPQAMSQVQAQFNLQADTENADLQQLKLKLDKTSINGNLGIANFAKPKIRPQLTIDTINVDDYLAPASETQKSAGSAQTGNQELLPLDALRSVNIDGDIKIGSMIVNKLSLSNINTRIKAEQGLINIDPANATLYKGDYTGRITLDARQAEPTMKMRHKLVGLRSEGLLFDLFQDKYISGDTRVVTEMNSKGNTIDALIRNLNGATEIAFKEGTIRDSNLAEKISLAVKAFEKEEVEGGKSVVKFTGLSGDLKTTNGIFKTDNLSLLAPYFNIFGEGSADLVQQKLDLQLRIGPSRDTERKIFAPLRIHGSFDDLKFSLDLESLVKALAKEDLDKAKQKVKEKLEAEKLKAQQKLDAEKLRLEQKLQAEKDAKLKQLQEQTDKAKADAIKKLQDKAGGALGDALKQQLGGNKDENASNEQAAEEAKSVEDKVKDQVKDKLKEGLKGLF